MGNAGTEFSMLLDVVSPSFFFLMGRGLGRGLGIGNSEVLD